MGPPDDPRGYSGTITNLQGSQLQFEVSDTSGNMISAAVGLQVTGDGSTFTGTIDAAQ
jgi:hypothetical protein